MTILNRKGIKRLCKIHKCNPMQIGCAILRICGYEVTSYYNGDVAVIDPKIDRTVYFFSSGLPNDLDL